MKLNDSKIQNVIDNLTFKFPYSVQQWINGNLFVENYHSHTDFSNAMTVDSPVSYYDYANRIKEIGGVCLFSGEHGSQGNQFEAYTIASDFNLKYVHSTEAYWVKNRYDKDSTNSHIYIAALNNEGRKDINYILSIANEDGYYYRPRIDLDLIFSLDPQNVIITTACLAFWEYEDIDEIVRKLKNHFQNHFFLEVQYHNTKKQKEINSHILDLSKKYNIPIIAGLDSHYIYETSGIKRDKILEYKHIKYENEEGWYLDYPNGLTIFQRFVDQQILNESEILTAMANTHIFNILCENIVFDTHFKIPCIYKDKTEEGKIGILKQHLNSAYILEKDKSKERIDGIRYETQQIIDSHVVDYFLTNEKIIDEAVNHQGGILTTTSRGSASSFYINKLLKFTTLDRFNSEIPIYPERFLTAERVLSGQMPDVDYNIAEQEPFVKAARKILGEHSCYPLMAIEKLKDKSAWQLYAGANNIDFQTANAISKSIDEYNEAIKYADENDKEYIKIESFIPNEYLDLYKSSIDYRDIIINLKCHPCGHLLLDGDIRREIGLISAISNTTNKRTLVAAVEGSFLDAFGYVKDDFLIVDSVGLIYECFKSINMNVPTIDELRTMIDNDLKTWEIYKNGITCCINQVEQESTRKKVMQYQPKNLAELSAFIAGIRPGFASLLPHFIKRESYSTGETKIDHLLEDSYHYMIYQESIMKVLGFLDINMSETYKIIKSISKKKLKGKAKDDLKEKLKKSWLNHFNNLNNFDSVWNVIEDSARYAFNAPHALSMAADSAYLAWFKAHHTAKFYEIAINHYQDKGKKGKIKDLIREINTYYGYSIGEYKFRIDNRRVNIDEKNKILYPNMNTIKGIQNVIADILWDLRDIKCQDGVDLIDQIIKYKQEHQLNFNLSSIEKLIKIDYFSEFGEINYLLKAFETYNTYSKRKTIKKSYALEQNWIISDWFNKETKSQYSDLDICKLTRMLLSLETIKPIQENENVKNQIEILGYTTIVNKQYPLNVFAIENIDKNKYGTIFLTLYRMNDGVSNIYKVNKSWYNQYPLEKGNMIKAVFDSKKKQNGETESIISVYSQII